MSPQAAAESADGTEAGPAKTAAKKEAALLTMPTGTAAAAAPKATGKGATVKAGKAAKAAATGTKHKAGKAGKTAATGTAGKAAATCQQGWQSSYQVG